jgi:N-methylhydantoinase B
MLPGPSSKYNNIVIHPGDRVHPIAPGGGGYRNPANRDPAATREDILEGYVTRRQAEATSATG